MILSPVKIKQRKCKVCKKKFMPSFNATQSVCSTTCAIKEANSIQDKQWKEKKQTLKDKIKTLSKYEAEARREFQAWIRHRDKGLPCISCGTTQASIWDAGHYLKAEIFSGLIFDPDNASRQCGKCNRFMGGNELGYRDGLIKRYGEKFVKDLEEKKFTHRNHKYTKQELIEIREHFRILLSQQKKTA